MQKDESLNYGFELSSDSVGWTSTPTLPVQKVKNDINGQIEQNFDENKDIGGKENLDGDTNAILNDLRENHVKVEDAEMMGFKGKKVHIELPAVKEFEGFKFEYFVSDDDLFKKAFEGDPELEKKSYSMSDISKLFQAMNKYMRACQSENDGTLVNYEYKLKYWETNIRTCKSGEYLKIITGLDGWCWLKDKNVDRRSGVRACRCCDGAACCFSLGKYDDSWGKLLMKLSD